MAVLSRSLACSLLVGLGAAGCSEGRLDAFDRTLDGGPPPRDASGTPLLIDDFEDGNTQALAPPSWWYVVNDTTANQVFQVEPEGSSGHAAHTWGDTFTAWGAGIGLDLRSESEDFDASAFTELRFRARAAPTSHRTLAVHLLESSSTHFILEVELTTEWQTYVIPFAQTRADVGGDARVLDRERLSALQLFLFYPERFDIWLDDFVFH